MDKLILKTPSFDLMEDVKKRFGVEFHPNTPITKIGEKLKEMGYGKTTTQASATIRQDNKKRKDCFNRVEEDKRKQKKLSLEIKSDKISS
jgi:hypothetical protein